MKLFERRAVKKGWVAGDKVSLRPIINVSNRQLLRKLSDRVTGGNEILHREDIIL